MGEIYDRIGKTYDTTRKADPGILDGLLAHLECSPGARILDVACGSGNYTIAVRSRGYRIEGLDISEEMLGKARTKAPDLTWHSGDAAHLPFQAAEFDGVLCVLATHHMHDVDAAFREMCRVLRSGAHVALFTSSPSQMKTFWLNHYLPGVVAVTGSSMLEFDILRGKLESAGFSDIKRTPYHVDNRLQDFFLHCGKYRPELYLDPVVRDGISSFALFRDTTALASGLARLEQDIRSGAVHDVIRRYEAENRLHGDFMTVSARK